MFGDIIKEVKEGKRAKTYEGYLSYIEDKINHIRDVIKNSDTLTHVVRKGDTLLRIARRYGTSVEALKKNNKITNPNNISRGQKIKIPISDENKEKLFWKRISGYSENLNYPAKFQAVIELIKDKVVTERDPKVEFSIYKVEGERTHVVAHGEWAIKIAKKYGISLNSLETSNSGVNLNNIKPGQVLNIPGSASSLSEIAKLKKVNIKRLCFLNPAILDINLPLPKGYNVKI